MSQREALTFANLADKKIINLRFMQAKIVQFGLKYFHVSLAAMWDRLSITNATDIASCSSSATLH